MSPVPMAEEERKLSEQSQKWLDKAELDLAVSKVILGFDQTLATAAGFHCRQAVEKYLKAFLAWNEIEIPETRDIDELLDLVGTEDELIADSLRETDLLTPYSIEILYPNDEETLMLTPEDGKEALRLAEKTRDQIMNALRKDGMFGDQGPVTI